MVLKQKEKYQPDERFWRLVDRVAKNVRRIREENGLTQEDMTLMGFERRWYQRIESGRHSISLPTLDQLSRAFKVDASDFFKK